MALKGERIGVSVAYVRGGTSKAMFFHEHDLPPPGQHRDQLLQRIMGAKSPIHIDGMGGGRIVTSKIAIIKPSDRDDADVDYTFAQVGIGEETIGYDGNCGNISSGIGPFAIDEGLVKVFRRGVSIDPKMKTQEVRIYNTGTKKVLISHVPLEEESGKSLETGETSIDGVPGTGAPLLLDYRNTVGASQNKGLLPSGNSLDTVSVGGHPVKITICDVANICIFANAADLCVSGHEPASSINDNTALIARCKELRGKAAALIGMCSDPEKVDEQSPFLPMVILVAPPNTKGAHLSARLFLDNSCHTSMAGTGAICLTACSRIPGSVVYNQIGHEALKDAMLQICHPMGIMPVSVQTEKASKASTDEPEFQTLSFVRTSRRIMDGTVYVPAIP